jgi:putative spermidine/putrescine transport system permease protein
MIMGASSLRIFLQVVLPQLKVAIAASLIFSFLTSFDEVVIAWFLSGPSSVTLPVRMYSAIMWENTPVIAAISTLLTLMSFALGMVAVLLGANPAGLRAGAKG